MTEAFDVDTKLDVAILNERVRKYLYEKLWVCIHHPAIHPSDSVLVVRRLNLPQLEFEELCWQEVRILMVNPSMVSQSLHEYACSPVPSSPPSPLDF